MPEETRDVPELRTAPELRELRANCDERCPRTARDVPELRAAVPELRRTAVDETAIHSGEIVFPDVALKQETY